MGLLHSFSVFYGGRVEFFLENAFLKERLLFDDKLPMRSFRTY